jgi:putative RecB family exonuclease
MRVVDYKTGRSPSELFEGKALFQMKFYALVLWRLRGEIPRLLQLVYLGNGEVVRYAPDEHDLLSLERNLKAVWTAIEHAATTGDWRPKTSRLCDWCDYREFCPAWGGTPPPLPENAALIALNPAISGQVAPTDE